MSVADPKPDPTGHQPPKIDEMDVSPDDVNGSQKLTKVNGQTDDVDSNQTIDNDTCNAQTTDIDTSNAQTIEAASDQAKKDDTGSAQTIDNDTLNAQIMNIDTSNAQTMDIDTSNAQTIEATSDQAKIDDTGSAQTIDNDTRNTQIMDIDTSNAQTKEATSDQAKIDDTGSAETIDNDTRNTQIMDIDTSNAQNKEATSDQAKIDDTGSAQTIDARTCSVQTTDSSKYDSQSINTSNASAEFTNTFTNDAQVIENHTSSPNSMKANTDSNEVINTCTDDANVVVNDTSNDKSLKTDTDSAKATNTCTTGVKIVEKDTSSFQSMNTSACSSQTVDAGNDVVQNEDATTSGTQAISTNQASTSDSQNIEASTNDGLEEITVPEKVIRKSLAKTPINLDFTPNAYKTPKQWQQHNKAMQKLCNIFHLDPVKTATFNRSLLNKRIKPYMPVKDILKTFPEAQKCKVIHISRIPSYFSFFHIRALIKLRSTFNINSNTYLIDFIKKDKPECLIRFLSNFTCLRIYRELQGLLIYGMPMIVKLDIGHKIANTYTRNGTGYRQKLIAAFVKLQNNTEISGDIDNENKEEGNKEMNSIEQAQRAYEDCNKELLGGIDNNSDGSDKKDTSNQQKKTEVKINETTKNGDEIERKVVSILYWPFDQGYSLLKSYIKHITNKDVKYTLRSHAFGATRIIILKFINSEDAITVFNKMNGTIFQGHKIKATLEKCHAGDVLKEKRKRKLGQEDLIDDDEIPVKKLATGITEQADIEQNNTDTVDLAVSYMPPEEQIFETYGLKPDFLKKLGIKLPLSTKIIVKNLHHEVDENKLLEVFSLAGEVKKVDIPIDMSKKKAFIVFDHPVEAVQAISLFNNHQLYGKEMKIYMNDRWEPRLLPLGLASIGMGLGNNGLPLRGVRTKVEIDNVNKMFAKMGKMNQTDDSDMPFQYHYANSRWDETPTSTWNTNVSNPPMQNISPNTNMEPRPGFSNRPPNPKVVDPWNTNNQSPLNQSMPPPQLHNNPNMAPQQFHNNPNMAPTPLYNNPNMTPSQYQNNQNMATPQLDNNQVIPSPQFQNNQDMVQNFTPNQGLNQIMNQLMLFMASNATTPNMMQTNMAQHNQMVSPTVGVFSQVTPNQNQMMGSSNLQNMNQNASTAAMINQPARAVDQTQSGWNATSHISASATFTQNSSATPTNATRNFNQQRVKEPNQSQFSSKPQGESEYRNTKKDTVSKSGPKERKMLSFKYLPPSVSTDALVSKMREVGELMFSEITGPGSAIVGFKNAQDAERCMRLFHKSKVDGQTIDVTLIP